MRESRYARSAGVFLDISVAAEHLQHLVHGPVQHLRAPHFHNGTLDRVLLDALLDFCGIVAASCPSSAKRSIDRSDDAIDQRLAGEDPSRHIRNLFLHQPKRGDRLAEGNALLRVANAAAKRIFLRRQSAAAPSL